ncbi:MAG: hypothetical protein RIC15_10595 [Vicingaceae bacterium]
MKKLLFFFALLLTLIASPELVQAQCAMCKAVVESNAQTGDNVVQGVNNAILYLMGIPYFLVLVMGYVWYKKFWKAEGN